MPTRDASTLWMRPSSPKSEGALVFFLFASSAISRPSLCKPLEFMSGCPDGLTISESSSASKSTDWLMSRLVTAREASGSSLPVNLPRKKPSPSNWAPYFAIVTSPPLPPPGGTVGAQRKTTPAQNPGKKEPKPRQIDKQLDGQLTLKPRLLRAATPQGEFKCSKEARTPASGPVAKT